MLIELLIRGFLFLVAGVANAFMDKMQFHYGKSKFPQNDTQKFFGKGRLYWNPSISWKNKYKDWDSGDKSAKFPLSKTWLVSLTDGWHFFQMIMLTSFSLAATPLMPELWQSAAIFLGLRLCFGAGFTYFFHTWLNRKDGPDEQVFGINYHYPAVHQGDLLHSAKGVTDFQTPEDTEGGDRGRS